MNTDESFIQKTKKFLQHIYKTALSLCIIQKIIKAVQYIFIYFLQGNIKYGSLFEVSQLVNT